MRSTTAHLALPFFDDVHRDLGQRLADWMPQQHIDESDDRQACKEWVKLLGANQWLRYCVPAGKDGALGGALEKLDSRALVILRETLAFHSPLADFAFAMQGWAAAPSRWRERPRSRPLICRRLPAAQRSPHLP
jgi:acyl-CoA dehydrogenase